MATYGYEKVTSLASIAWNTWVDLSSTVSSITATIPTPTGTESEEIFFTFTTGSSVSSSFWNLTAPSGYYIVGDYANPEMLPNIVYQASLFNTDQEIDVSGTTYICLGLIVYPWYDVS